MWNTWLWSYFVTCPTPTVYKNGACQTLQITQTSWGLGPKKSTLQKKFITKTFSQWMYLKVVEKRNSRILNRSKNISDFERCITYAAPCTILYRSIDEQVDYCARKFNYWVRTMHVVHINLVRRWMSIRSNVQK